MRMSVNTFSQHVKVSDILLRCLFVHPRALVSEGAFGGKKETAVHEDDMLTGIWMETRVQSACFLGLPFVIVPTSLSFMLPF